MRRPRGDAGAAKSANAVISIVLMRELVSQTLALLHFKISPFDRSPDSGIEIPFLQGFLELLAEIILAFLDALRSRFITFLEHRCDIDPEAVEPASSRSAGHKIATDPHQFLVESIERRLALLSLLHQHSLELRRVRGLSRLAIALDRIKSRFDQ